MEFRPQTASDVNGGHAKLIENVKSSQPLGKGRTCSGSVSCDNKEQVSTSFFVCSGKPVARLSRFDLLTQWVQREWRRHMSAMKRSNGYGKQQHKLLALLGTELSIPSQILSVKQLLE